VVGGGWVGGGGAVAWGGSRDRSLFGESVGEHGFFFGFWFLVCYANTQVATQLHQRRVQVVRSNKVAQKRLTESNGTPAVDFGSEEIRKRRYTQTKNRTKHTNTILIVI